MESGGADADADAAPVAATTKHVKGASSGGYAVSGLHNNPLFSSQYEVPVLPPPQQTGRPSASGVPSSSSFNNPLYTAGSDAHLRDGAPPLPRLYERVGPAPPPAAYLNPLYRDAGGVVDHEYAQMPGALDGSEDDSAVVNNPLFQNPDDASFDAYEAGGTGFGGGGRSSDSTSRRAEDDGYIFVAGQRGEADA